MYALPPTPRLEETRQQASTGGLEYLVLLFSWYRAGGEAKTHPEQSTVNQHFFARDKQLLLRLQRVDSFGYSCNTVTREVPECFVWMCCTSIMDYRWFAFGLPASVVSRISNCVQCSLHLGMDISASFMLIKLINFGLLPNSVSTLLWRSSIIIIVNLCVFLNNVYNRLFLLWYYAPKSQQNIVRVYFNIYFI